MTRQAKKAVTLHRFRVSVALLFPEGTSLEDVTAFLHKAGLPIARADYSVRNESLSDHDRRLRWCDRCPNEWHVRYREGRKIVARLCRACEPAFVAEVKKATAQTRRLLRGAR